MNIPVIMKAGFFKFSYIYMTALLFPFTPSLGTRTLAHIYGYIFGEAVVQVTTCGMLRFLHKEFYYEARIPTTLKSTQCS